MAISFNLKFMRTGRLGGHPWGAPLMIPQAGGHAAIEELIHSASREQILLKPIFSDARTQALAKLDRVWPIDLHEELARLCGNVAWQLPIRSLGIIFAPKYGPYDTVLGAMFDTGFQDEDQTGLPYEHWSIPREGCAVFTERIRELRDADQFDAQVLYTLVHELGHVFNLQHTDGEGCFLDTSPAGGRAPGRASYRFLRSQMDWLSLCEGDRRVQPGRMGFGSLDYFGSLYRIEGDHLHSPPHLPRLTVSLGGQEKMKEFFRWEPVELELQLHAPETLEGSYEVPDELDPGYRRFVVWIEEPSGERRRYRPTKHYCSNQAVIALEVGKSVRRDLSIFGQSGGLTFHHAGVHRVWLDFQLPGGDVISSNKLEFEILPDLFGDRRARRRQEELRELFRKAAKLFFYRSGVIRKAPREALEALIRRARGKHLGSAADYAMGRLLAHQARRVSRRGDYWLNEARPYLERAQDSPLLNPHRCWRAAQALLPDAPERKREVEIVRG